MKSLKLFLLSAAALFLSGLRKSFATANSESTVGRHAVATTKLSDGAFASRHLLVVIGSDDDHVTTAGAAAAAWGLSDDQPSAAGDPINVHFLGAQKGTMRLVSTGALADGVPVYQAAAGLVQGLPTAPGTYFEVGQTKGAAFQGDDSVYQVEVLVHEPSKLVIIAAFTSSTTAAASDLASSEALANALKADLIALTAALATPTKLVIV